MGFCVGIHEKGKLSGMSRIMLSLYCIVLYCFVSFVSFIFFFYENVEKISDPLGIQLGFFPLLS